MKKETVELPVQGMTCPGCAAGIERQLKKIGLSDASVNLATHSAQFTLHQPELLPQVISEIERLGFFVPQAGKEAKQKRFSLTQKFVFCLLWTLPLLLHMVLPLPLLGNGYFQLAVCLPVLLVGLEHFGSSAFRALRAGTTNMDVLIALSITAAFLYSLYGTLAGLGHNFLFYETSATIVTIVLFGNVLEERAIRRTTTAIEELTKIQPARALLVLSNGETREIQASEIRTGDLLAVNSGDRIPCDGTLASGTGTLDQSMLTGESMPVETSEESRLVGGSVLVSGNIRMRATAVGDSTVLSNMIRLVRQAQSSKPRIQNIGDRVSAVFVPAVALIALATLLLTWLALGTTFGDALLRSIAVLVIACPCAVGLAIPTAVMAGVGQAARNGILIKGGDTLELLARARQVIFDKTGTLTSGTFKLQAVETTGLIGEPLLRSIVRGLEERSSHPIARSVVQCLSESAPLEFSQAEEHRGLGMQGTAIDGTRYFVGSYASAKDTTRAEPGHDLYVHNGSQCLGWMDLDDEITPGAIQAIAYLRKRSIESVIVSGDSERKVKRVADALGITRYFAGQLPEEKLERLTQLESEAPSCFVGDGINDAPALARAHVGISLSNATEAAIQSARIVLLHGDLAHLTSAFAICGQSYTTMKQNLFWAFFYNALAIPLAAAGYLTPTIAAFSMAFSDIIVIGNSLRLRHRSVRP